MDFNPGWDSNARKLKAQGVPFQEQADEKATGPASSIALDPDGNPILVDQHV